MKYEELSSSEISALDKEKTVIFMPISPIEGHGPHLPVGVDFFDAIYFAQVISQITLKKCPEFDVLVYPGIPLGTQIYRQPGSVRIDNVTLYRVIVHLGQSLASSGFKYVFMLSGHGSPKDIVASESACRKIRRKCRIKMFNISGALAVKFLKGEFSAKISERLSKPLSQEEIEHLSKDIHGGWWETSMMLLLKPELVNPLYKDLPGVERTAELIGPKAGYIGSPARASEEFAKVSLEILSEEAAKIIEDGLTGKNIVKATTSPLSKILPFRPYFPRYFFVILTIIVLIMAVLFYLL